MSKKTQVSHPPITAITEPEGSNAVAQSAPDDPRAAASPSGEAQARTPKGKLGAIASLLKRPEGATIEQLMNATRWKSHSVRGAMAGALTKKHGLKITSEKTEAGRIYRAKDGVDK